LVVLPDDQIILQPRKWPALIPFGMAVLMFSFLQPPINKGLNITCLILVAFSFLLRWILSKSRIAADSKGIVIFNVFGKREMPWSRISQSYIRYRHHGKSGSYYWYFENTEGGRIKFPINLHSRRNLHQLAEMLRQYSPSATVENRVQRMADGNFPWYIF